MSRPPTVGMATMIQLGCREASEADTVETLPNQARLVTRAISRRRSQAPKVPAAPTTSAIASRRRTLRSVVKSPRLTCRGCGFLIGWCMCHGSLPAAQGAAEAVLRIGEIYRNTTFFKEAGLPTRPKSPKGDRQKQLSDADFRKLAAFRHALRTFLAFSSAEAESVGLAPQQHQALLAIRGWPEAGPPTIKDLAGQLLIRHNSAVELVHRLEDGGYLRRKAAVEDH